MAARRRAFLNRAEYLLVLGLDRLAGLVPGFVVLALARGLSRLVQCLLRGRVRRAATRIEHCLALPRGDPRVGAIVSGSFATLGLNVVEPMLVERRLAAGRPLGDFVRIEGREHLDRAFASGRGVLVCTGHLGAWELIPLFLAALELPIWAMARPLTNPLLERYVLERRLRCVRGTVPKDGGGLKLARILRAGEPLGLLLDQNAGSNGVIMDFLGLPSSHHTVSGVMAQRFGALAVPVYLLREERPLRFRLVVEPPIEADPRLPPEQAQLDVVRRLSRSLEARVRRHPEQWLWLHDRWRHALRMLEEQVRPAASTRVEHTRVPVVQGTNGA